MAALFSLIVVGAVYLGFRLITKKRLRDLKLRWSFVVFALGLAPIAYFLFGWLEREGLIHEIYSGHAYDAMFGGTLGSIIFSPIAFVFAVILFKKERQTKRQE